VASGKRKQTRRKPGVGGVSKREPESTPAPALPRPETKAKARFRASFKERCAAAELQAPPRPKVKRKAGVGGVNKDNVPRPVSSGHRWCVAGCQGRHVDHMWIHDTGCPEIRMLWKAHDYTAADWACPHGCPANEMPSGYTHHWQCRFWEANDLTPFSSSADDRQKILARRNAEHDIQGLLDIVNADMRGE
jgi:hypothetical protein